MFTQLKDYKVIKLIGKGSFGEVYKVSKDNKFYALKMYKISNEMNNSNSLTQKEKKENLKSIENEIKILSQLDSPFIVKLYEVFSMNLNEEIYNIKDETQDDNDQIMCLVLELCENGDLNDKIKEKKQKNEIFSEKEILKYFYEILQGLYYLHKNRVLHRDLKTLNIFLTKDNHIKIGDFGVSKKLINNNIYAYTFVGTPYYLSPEICQNKAYDEKSDVWSLGVIIYELITLNKPFDSQSQMGLFMKILKGKPAPIINTIKHSYSQKLINLVIENLLDKDPLTRYGILQTINSGIFDKFFREKELQKRMLQKKKNEKNINNENNNLNNNNNRKNTNRNKATNNNSNVNNKINENKTVIKSNIITDSKRVRTNPLKGSIKASTLSRRAQIAKIPGKKTKPEASIHEKHLQMNNKYLNTYKEKISKGEPRITASKYLHDVLLNDNEDEIYNDSIPYEITENKILNNNIINNNNEIINTINNNFYLDNNNIDISNNEEDEKNDDNKIRPQFKMMNENVIDNNNEFDDTNGDNTLSELLKDSEFYHNEKEEIPIIDNFEDVANDKKVINDIKDKEKTLEELEKEAYDKFGKEIVDDILNKYDEYQNDMNFDQTKELDDLIFKKMNGEKSKYVEFLEIFYKIIYIKCAQQVEKTT